MLVYLVEEGVGSAWWNGKLEFCGLLIVIQKGIKSPFPRLYFFTNFYTHVQGHCCRLSCYAWNKAKTEGGSVHHVEDWRYLYEDIC